MRLQTIAPKTAWLPYKAHLFRDTERRWASLWRGFLATLSEAVAIARRLHTMPDVSTAEYALLHRLEL